MRKRVAEKRQTRAVTVGKTKTGKTATQKRQVARAKKASPKSRVSIMDTKEKRLLPYTNQYGSRS